jgi:glycosyltransferase A (GT-A) superfamily protein (DUF2064 family)
MWRAYRSVADHYSRVVFLGADSPSLPLSMVRQAFERLREVSAVLSPAIDGGYTLLGISEPLDQLFYDMPWGTSQLCSTTLNRLEGIHHELLPVWYDIDCQADLWRLILDLREPFEGFPERTLSFLKSSQLVTRGIAPMPESADC